MAIKNVRTVAYKTLSDRLAKQHWLTKALARTLLDSFFHEVEYELLQWKNVAIKNMFSLKTRKIKWKVMFNTKFKKHLPIDAHRWFRCVFSPSIMERMKVYDRQKKD